METKSEKAMFTGSYRHRPGLQWSYSSSGVIMARDNKTSQLYLLKENYILVWILISRATNFARIHKHSGLEKMRLRALLDVLIQKNLIVNTR